MDVTSMTAHQITLKVVGESPAEGNWLVSELEEVLQTRTDCQSLTRPGSATTQDLGTVLVAVLSAPAVTAFAKGIADWMRRRNVSIHVAVDGHDSVHIEGPAAHVEGILRQMMADKPH
jgi:hypothetical protein